jgi:TonB family protein
MHDAVADVLVERQALSRPPRAAIVLSIALHAGTALFVVSSTRPERPLDRPMAINMRLAPPAAPAAQQGGSRIQRPAPAPPPKVDAQAPQTAVVKPPEAKEVKGRVDPVRTAEKSVFGKSAEPATPKKSKAAVPAIAPPGVPAAGGGTAGAAEAGAGGGEFALPGVGAAGVTGLEGGSFPYAMYIDRMTTKIGSNWFRPPMNSEALTVVYFVIERNGAIRDARVERSSGNRMFDRAAYRAVVESSPLPPLPIQYTGSYLGVHLTFH